MKKTTEHYYCDICGEEAQVVTISYPVIFHTEQAEGKECTPFVSSTRLDMCVNCQKQALIVHGRGVPGRHKYTIHNNN